MMKVNENKKVLWVFPSILIGSDFDIILIQNKTKTQKKRKRKKCPKKLFLICKNIIQKGAFFHPQILLEFFQ